MPKTSQCPDASRLIQLLDRELPDAEQAALTSHLDACEVCQKTVEDIASGGKSWAEVAGYLRQEKPGANVEPGLKRVLQEPNGQPSLTQTLSTQEHEEADPVSPRNTIDTEVEPGQGPVEALAFLTPSPDPKHLGRLDNYAILEVVGQGGMGIVLKAFDEQLHRIVAVKVLAPQLATSASARRRFIREAQAAAAVCHDHVVTIHAVNAGTVPYLVMQLVAGYSLQDKLEKSGALGLKEILRIGLQTAEGLAAAHKQGLVHRDIKPANILLENGVERVKITDFGLARAVDDASLTQSGVVAGTPQYMSPEQAQGESVDHRSDLFSLGSVLYAMCTGRPPFRASGTMAVLKRVCEETPRPIREINREIPDWLCAIVAKLQAKNPADRFQSAKEVADLLSQHLAHLQQPRLVPAPAAVTQTSSEGEPIANSVDVFATDRKKVSRTILAGIWTFFLLPILWAFLIPYLGVIWSTTIFVLALAASLFLFPVKRTILVVGAITVLAVGGVVFEYKQPMWWNELWNLGGQPDRTTGTVSINWTDPDLRVVIDKGGGTSYGFDRSPFVQGLSPGAYTLRAMRGEEVVYEVEFILSPGESRLINLPPIPLSAPALARAPFTAEEAEQHQKAWAKHLGVPVETTNAIGMKLRLIPPGEFQMGMTSQEMDLANKDRSPDHWLVSSTKTSGPQHKVTLSKPFYCATTEVTIGQFRRFVEATGYQTDAEKDGKGGARWDERQKKMTQDPRLNWKTPGYHATDDSPVTQVTWNDAVAFCNWLNAMQGLGESYRSVQGPWWKPTNAKGCRLPTEAQWEFACRAGATTNYFWGTDEGMLRNYAWYSENSSGKTHPVATKAANPFGLFDMQGNVSELCQDLSDNKEYKSLDVIDPEGTQAGTCYVRRGANFASQSKDCASAQRLLGLPFDVRHDDTGFRVVQDILPAVKASTPPLAKAPFTSEEAKQHQEAWAQHLGVPVETTNSVGIKLALIPPGEFNMGLTAAEIEAAITRIKNRPNDNWLVYAYKTSGPLHKVVLTKPYYAATTHVTIGQFREFVKAKKYLTDAERGGGGSRWDEQQKKMIQDPKLTWKAPGYDVTDQSPVTEVTWNDAVAFCNWLSAKEGLGQPYELVKGSWRPTSAPGYRLPTEAQWEYACRAGATSLHFGGNDDEAFARHAWFVKNSNGKAQPVGAKLPNAFGLFDMEGNADQFCQDFFDPNYYERNERYDPLGPDTGLTQLQPHVRRGSSWGASADAYVIGLRMSLDLKAAQGGVGFRVVRDVLRDAKGSPPSAARAPFTSDEAKNQQEAWAKQAGVPVTTTNSAGMKMVLIPPGEFRMGLTDEEIEAATKKMTTDHWLYKGYKACAPAHRVTLSQPFYCSATEVTIGQFRKFVEATGFRTEAEADGKGGTFWDPEQKKLVHKADLLWKSPGYPVTDDSPVTQVTWNDAVAYCVWLSEQEKLPCPYFGVEGPKSITTAWTPLPGEGYRLPTEAQWEYACRAGTETAYFFGNSDASLSKHAWFASNSGGRAHPVATVQPNVFGLFDMHGNATEFCQDFFLASYYEQSPPVDPAGPGPTVSHVRRGGGWGEDAEACTSALRLSLAQHDRQQGTGFRVIRQIAVPDAAKSAPVATEAGFAIAPFDGQQALAYQETAANRLGAPIEFKNSIGMKLGLIPPGEFLMGTSDKEKEKVLQSLSEDWQKGFIREELSARRVRIPSAFYLGVTELTVGQFKRFVKATGYKSTVEADGLGGRAVVGNSILRRPEWTWKHADVAESDDHPVVQISLADAQAFCRWLSKEEGRAYYVPNEEEWEFACRAGTETPWYIGANAELMDGAAWTVQNADGKTHPVGEKKPNAFGLYDMLGNAEEVCVSDTGLPVARGGHASLIPLLCRSGSRVPVPVKETFYRRGVRIAAKTAPLPIASTAPDKEDNGAKK
ncbi:MAG: SUMF1/EgtB/PvdO family nonheme iron enzyme [Gemmataceae bacterium]